MKQYAMEPIAHIRSDFGGKFGIPRQSGLVPALEARIILAPKYRTAEALRGLTQWSHLWLIWVFDQAQGWSSTVRPPRLGGNTRMGVFATRSPFRPNPIGLSCVRLLRVEETAEGPVPVVGGADLADGTPILDIKPYVPYADTVPEASSGFSAGPDAHVLRVRCDDALLTPIPAEKRAGLLGVLACDPRPAYQADASRVYGLTYAGCNVRFQVAGEDLTVLEIKEATP